MGAIAQGWLRAIDADGQRLRAGVAERRSATSLGVHVLFLSEHDLPRRRAAPASFSHSCPIVALTRGWEGSPC